MGECSEPRVGERVRALREDRGYSLRGLAQRCGLSVNAVSLIEKGENSPTVASLHRLAEALGTSITDFFEDQARQTAVLVKNDNRLTVERNGIRMGSLGMGLER